jgi:polysaccharide export outer membrane protein
MYMTRSTQIGCAAMVMFALGAGTIGAQNVPAGRHSPKTPPATSEAEGSPAATSPAASQSAGARSPAAVQAASAPATPAGVTPPSGYIIGPDDVLSIVYFRDKDMTADVVVRPDGMISLSLLNDIVAAGLTPDQLRQRLVEASKKYIEDPNITVVVKTINSRKVFIMGQVAKPGSYPLTAPATATAMHLIALAGGLGEEANSKNIKILRTENGRQVAYKLNYQEVISGKNLAQNIELKPGDIVVVP